jgi:arylsulfatase A-like enzyme
MHVNLCRLVIFVAASAGWRAEAHAAAGRDRAPNVVLIIADDMGYGDYGFMGHRQVHTPRLDRLARASLTFRRGYVTSSLCSPSLASILTGR